MNFLNSTNQSQTMGQMLQRASHIGNHTLCSLLFRQVCMEERGADLAER